MWETTSAGATHERACASRCMRMWVCPCVNKVRLSLRKTGPLRALRACTGAWMPMLSWFAGSAIKWCRGEFANAVSVQAYLAQRFSPNRNAWHFWAIEGTLLCAWNPGICAVAGDRRSPNARKMHLTCQPTGCQATPLKVPALNSSPDFGDGSRVRHDLLSYWWACLACGPARQCPHQIRAIPLRSHVLPLGCGRLPDGPLGAACEWHDRRNRSGLAGVRYLLGPAVPCASSAFVLVSDLRNFKSV